MTNDQGPKQRVRIRFAKGEPLKYISHLDMARTWERVFRRARLPVAYSQGYNPRPRFQIAAALPVGVTGRAELLDLWLVELLEPGAVQERLEVALPPGLDVSAVVNTDLREPSLQSQMRAAHYRAVIHSREPVEEIRIRAQALLDALALPRQRHHKGKMQNYDLRRFIQELMVELGPEGVCTMTMRLQASPQGAGQPGEVLDAMGLSKVSTTVERTSLVFDFDK